MMTSRTITPADLLRIAVLAAVALALPSVHTAPAVKVPMMPPARVELTRPPGTLPPLEFDHPYVGALAVTRPRSPAELLVVCGGAGHGVGCAFPSPDSSHVVILADEGLAAAGLDPRIVMRHEIGHCNGWGADHAGGDSHERDNEQANIGNSHLDRLRGFRDCERSADQSR